MTRPFHFRQFTIKQEKAAMKVGFDAVLLGAWADVSGAKRILDIGTGSGVIALMLAQRRPAAQVDAVEIDAGAAAEATDNVRRSPSPDRVRVLHRPIQTHEAPPYDLIVCNPPFFDAAAGTPAPAAPRRLARHDQTLTIKTVMASAERLLGEEGCLALIWPFGEEERLVRAATAVSLHLTARTTIRPTPQKPPHRLLCGFKRRSAARSEGEIVIESARHQYTKEFSALTEPFYFTER
jgi:tRNA1Val (adenine37-N6)-methyltransferase